DVQLQRIGWQQAAMGELVIEDFEAIWNFIDPVEPADQEKRANMELKLFFQQIRCREVAAVDFPVASQQRPPLSILALGQRASGVIVIALEVGQERIKRNRCRREERLVSRPRL